MHAALHISFEMLIKAACILKFYQEQDTSDWTQDTFNESHLKCLKFT